MAKRLVQAFFYNNPDNYPPIINSARLLAAEGWEVELYCRDDGKHWGVSYPSGVSVERIKAAGPHSWQEYSSFLWTAVRQGRRKASVFIGHDMHGLLPARLLASILKRPLIYHCHDFAERQDRIPLGSRMVRSFEQRFARSSDLVIIPDAGRARVIKRELRLKNEPLIVANAPLKQETLVSKALRAVLAARGGCLERIVFRQGRIGVGHSIEATLHSLPHWTDRKWGFVVMGLGDVSYIERLVALSKSLGVEKQFVVLPPVGYDQVASFTVDADVGHALYEPIHVNNVHITTASNKIMEYMRAGLPLLVSNSPSLRALVERYKCGFAVDEQSPHSIAQAVNALLGNLERARGMGAAAAKAFENEFSFQRQFAPVVEAINSHQL